MKERYPLFDGETLADAKARFKKTLRDTDEATCPCCERGALRVHRPIDHAKAALLVWLYWRGEAHIGREAPRGVLRGKDFALLRYWDLIEQRKERGSWAITPTGRRFVERRCLLPERVVTYDRRAFGFSGPLISIGDALGRFFDYDDLMRRYRKVSE